VHGAHPQQLPRYFDLNLVGGPRSIRGQVITLRGAFFFLPPPVALGAFCFLESSGSQQSWEVLFVQLGRDLTLCEFVQS
jgi:hypothetical protein